MKKTLSLIFVVLLISVSYFAWPIYQGLAYKGNLPIVGFDYVTWPSKQPTESEVFNGAFESVGIASLEVLRQQQSAISAPGYTAAVALDGKLLWAGAVGWADISLEKPMTTDTVLRVGSTSKAITATGLAQLVKSDALDLDAPLSRYFDVVPQISWSNITARQLVSHMAGMPHYKDNTEWLGKLQTVSAKTHYVDVTDAVSLFDETDMLFKPAEQFHYSSLGFVLLSAVMQNAAEQRYQEYMAQAVFTPLKMDTTFAGMAHVPNEKRATHYWQNPKKLTQLKPWHQADLSHRLAGGGWASTSKDLVKLGQGFMNDEFIPANVRQMFWTPQVLSSGETNPQKYGLGWRVHSLDLGEGFKPMVYMHHGGVSAGAQSFLMVVPEYKLAIAVNANIRTEVFWDFGKVSYELARLFINELEKRPQTK